MLSFETASYRAMAAWCLVPGAAAVVAAVVLADDADAAVWTLSAAVTA